MRFAFLNAFLQKSWETFWETWAQPRLGHEQVNEDFKATNPPNVPGIGSRRGSVRRTCHAFRGEPVRSQVPRRSPKIFARTRSGMRNAFRNAKRIQECETHSGMQNAFSKWNLRLGCILNSPPISRCKTHFEMLFAFRNAFFILDGRVAHPHPGWGWAFRNGF